MTPHRYWLTWLVVSQALLLEAALALRWALYGCAILCGVKR
jgi:hypothetical protein